MAIGNYVGRARTSSTNPTAKGECDRCGFWYQRSSLARQFQWAGASLQDQGFLVCRKCLDVPQEQYRTIILPPDPMPVVNPRQSKDGSSGIGADFGLCSNQNSIASTANLASNSL